MYRAPQDLDATEMRRRAHEAIDVFEELGNAEGLAQAYSILSEAALSSGEATAALHESERALVHALRAETRVLSWGLCYHIGRSMWVGDTAGSVALDRFERIAVQVSNHRAGAAAAKNVMGWFLAFLKVVSRRHGS